MKTAISAFLSGLLLLAFSVPSFSEILKENLFEKLRSKEPKRPEFICRQGMCKKITYFDGGYLMVAEVTINDQVFLGWRPPCDPYCGSINVEFAMAAEALEEQVKSQFPDARLEETHPGN